MKTKVKRKKNSLNSNNWQFWIIISLPLLYVIIFHYLPMTGILMAFKDYSVKKGIWASDWVGLMYFEKFLTSPSSLKVVRNTIILGAYSLVVNFPFPIILAIMLNEIRSIKFKKSVQMVTYAPYFISIVVLVGMMMQMMDMRTGIINIILQKIGLDPINFFGDPDIFRHLYVWSGLWQTMGYSAIIYIAALAGVSPELKEAAIVDGATRFQRIWHVDLPCISPTIIIMLIFACGNIVNIGFDKVYLMQNTMNAEVSEVISTFVYKVGIVNSDLGFSTAVGLFQSVLSFVSLVIVNKVCKLVSGISLW